ncbi:MAG: MFS transporter [Streptosporangiales bacterium]
MLPRTYRTLLSTPGVGTLLAASLAARLPTEMAMIALSFWTHDVAGTFAWSGLVIGAYTAGIVVAAPLLGRIADRYGPARVVLPCGAAWAVGYAALAVLPASVWWLAFALAAIAGAVTPPVGPTVRATWPRLVGRDALRTAYSLEATVQELMFAVGPLLAAVLVSFVGSRGALLGCGVVALVGTWWFGSRRPLRALRGLDRAPAGAGPRLLVHRARLGLVLGMVLMIAAFAAAELGMIAYAEHAGQRWLSGVLGLVWSLGSFAGGLVAGAALTHGRAAPWRRVGLVAVGFVGCALVSNVWWLGALLVLAGAMIAPSMAAINERMGELAPSAARTEAFAWMSAAGMAGGGIGAAVAGTLVAAYGSAAGFVLAVGLCVLAALVLVPAGRTLASTAVECGQPA